jgi:serine/threonine protein kinase
MSAESKKPRDMFAEQLVAFDARFDAVADNIDVLTDIRERIGALLSSNGSTKAEIRRVVQERYAAGELREETFQLVDSMLVRLEADEDRTTPMRNETPSDRVPLEADSETAPATEPEDDDSFGATTVLSNDAARLTDADARVQVGSILRDRFLLKEKVSGGSMGVVYKALDRRLAEVESSQPYVAIKVLSPALAEDGLALRALQQEAAKTRCLVHPNIVRFIDLDRDEDLYFLILEWLEGRTLADILDSRDAGSIDREAAFRIVRQVGDALDYAHRCGIVHADVKPGNIMMMPNGDAKLFDFGVARVRQKQAENEFDPGVLGAMTPAYSSLQVLGGEDPVVADDVFSLACLLYRLVAGYRVFGPRNAVEASQAGMQPQRPQGLTDDQWNAIKKALAYARVTRFKSVREFVDALGHKVAQDKTADNAINFEPPKRSRVTNEGSSPGKWVAVIVVLLGLAAIGANQMGYLEPWLAPFRDGDRMVEIAPPETIVEEIVADPIADTNFADEETLEADTAAADTAAAEQATSDAVTTEAEEQDVRENTEVQNPVVTEPETPASESTESEPARQVTGLVDFSRLPPADATVRIAQQGDEPSRAQVVLREDGDPIVVDFIRPGDPEEPLALRLEEIEFTGGTSPWASGQYALSNAGLVSFPAGQDRARITFRMASDPRREADQQSTLRLRPTDAVDGEVAIVNVTLEDDDRRSFETRLPTNTIGFAINQISVSESDPAVQIDVMRFNPDETPMTIGLRVEALTATEGEDYFDPGQYELSFAPGERSARLLIPLVQDSRAEGDEAFVVKLDVDRETQPNDVSPNLAVMIRDDDL